MLMAKNVGNREDWLRLQSHRRSGTETTEQDRRDHSAAFLPECSRFVRWMLLGMQDDQ